MKKRIFRKKQFDMSSRTVSQSISKNRNKRPEKEYQKILYTKRWQEKRNHIKERDKHFCQRCWIKFNVFETERLEVHHIKNRLDYPELTFEDSNMITICKTCNLELGSAHKLDFDWTPPNGDEFIL